MNQVASESSEVMKWLGDAELVYRALPCDRWGACRDWAG